MRVIRALSAAAAGCVLLLSAGCAAHHSPPKAGPHLVVSGDDGSVGRGVAFQNVRPGDAFTTGDLPVCLTGDGTVTISRILPLGVLGDLRVDSFAAIPDETEHGRDGVPGGPGPITRVVAHPDRSRTVNSRCAAHPGGTSVPGVYHTFMVVVEYSKTSAGTAGDLGIMIQYATGEEETLLLQANWTITLCAPGDVTTSHCGPQH